MHDTETRKNLKRKSWVKTVHLSIKDAIMGESIKNQKKTIPRRFNIIRNNRTRTGGGGGGTGG